MISSLSKTYYINGIPFTFDEIPTLVQDDPEIIAWANEQLTMTPEILYQEIILSDR
jgi:hypothetical protein